MPNPYDPARETLIQTVARTESLHVTQVCLEHAIAKKDSYTITVASELIQDILSGKQQVKPRLDGVTFPINSIFNVDRQGRPIEDRRSKMRKYMEDFKQGPRQQPCKPEDCPTCFWNRWCSMKEDYDVIDSAIKTLSLSKKLVAGSEAKLIRRDAESEPFNMRLRQVAIAEAKEHLDGTMTPQKQEIYDRAQGRQPKNKPKSQTMTAPKDWHLTEKEKQRKKLMYGS